MTVTQRFTQGLHLLCIAALLAALALMVAPAPMLPAEAAGQGPWVIVVLNQGGHDPQGNELPGALYTVDSATGALYGPFLQGQLGTAGGGLFDVAVTPNCRTAIVSNFGDSTVYFVDFSDPTDLQLIGSLNLGFFAEDIAITADGKFALVADGGFSNRLASINIATGTLVEVQDLGDRYANAVDVAPDGTVIVADYFTMKVHTLTIDSSGNLTPAQSYDLPIVIEHGEKIYLRPVNVAVAPDGRTVLVLATVSDHVPVYRISGPGTLEYVGLVQGLPAVWNENTLGWSGSQQSVAFNCQGTQAYVLTNGRGCADPNCTIERPSQISVLDISGPGQVSLRIASAADIPDQGSSQLFGVDCLAVAGGKLYVSNPTISHGRTYLRVVDLYNYSVSVLPVGQFEDSIIAGVAVCPGACQVRAAVYQVPVIQVGGGWETWIQAQNVGTRDTKFALLLFGYSGPYCGPQCNLPAKIEFSGRVPVGGAWSYKLATANTWTCGGAAFAPTSGILVSLSMAQAIAIEAMSCSDARTAVYRMWANWVATMQKLPVPYTNALPAGEPAAVSVNRIQTGAGGTPRAAAYTGIADWEMETGPDPRTGAYMYYAPQLFDTFSPAGWSSRIWIQNSGFECTSLEVWFQKQQDCLKARIQQVLALCPGEVIAVDPELPGFLGSAWIRASQPLGVIVDEFNANGSILMSYRGMPAEYYNYGDPAATMGSLFNFAPLIYREYNGWNAGVVVQNLSSVYNALVKVYFLDNSGDIIDTIVEWICPRGSQTFYLPAINNLPGMYVGQARVESQNWWGPGDPPVGAPNVLSVVNLVNYNTGQGAAYNTFPKHEAMGVKWVALPFLAKDKRDPYEPPGTKWTSEIAMTNLDMTPGTTVYRIDFFDQNGLLYSLCQTLNEKQVDYVKLANIGIIPPGWLGSAVISKMCSEPYDVGALGVVVVEKASGYPSGDLTKSYEGFPLFAAPGIPAAVNCPECAQMPCQDPWGEIHGWVTNKETGAPIAGATVIAWNCNDFARTTTNADGSYHIHMLGDENCSTVVEVGAPGYVPEAATADLHHCDSNVISFEMHLQRANRVLFYYGNAGVGPATDTYYQAKAFLEALGFTVDYTAAWPTSPNLAEYKTIFLLGPGHGTQEAAGSNFSAGQVAQMSLFLQGGGRLVVMTDHSGWTGQAVENDLLTKLTFGDLRFNSQIIPDNLVNQITQYHNIVQNIAVLDFDDDTGSTVGGLGHVLGRINASHATNPGEVIVAAWTPGTAGAGDIVTIGDLNWMDDWRWLNGFNWPADNENLLFNLVAF